MNEKAEVEKLEMCAFCGNCERKTLQTFEARGHRRDGSYDKQTCHECGYFRYEISNNWFSP